jgi:transposase
MIIFPKGREVFIRPGPTDMRKAVNGLSLLVQDHMEMDSLSGNYFIFCNRRRNLMKILYYDKNGFSLWYKRLEKHRFPWPNDEASAKKLTKKEAVWLLKGIDFFNAHKELKYKTV